MGPGKSVRFAPQTHQNKVSVWGVLDKMPDREVPLSALLSSYVVMPYYTRPVGPR